MGKIQKLPDSIASQIAAGEVVERPASMLKELVENSLDAGATQIDVEYQKGGRVALRVSDNGCGMNREDAVLSLDRHATSKLQQVSDLNSILTFGFRGEALPSMASVCQFRLNSRSLDSDRGITIHGAGGVILGIQEYGMAVGTQVELRSLFYNLPVRRKFLRGERTESLHLDQTFRLLALSHPSIHFSLIKDQRTLYRLPSVPDVHLRAMDLFGEEWQTQIFEAQQYEGRFKNQDIRVSGLLGRPGGGRSDRAQHFLFVNGRSIINSRLSQTLREAYGTAVPQGQYPKAVVFIDMDPSQVDCNIHPAKREVRFLDEYSLEEALQEWVRCSLDHWYKSQQVVSLRLNAAGKSEWNLDKNRNPGGERSASLLEPGSSSESGGNTVAEIYTENSYLNTLIAQEPASDLQNALLPPTTNIERFNPSTDLDMTSISSPDSSSLLSEVTLSVQGRHWLEKRNEVFLSEELETLSKLHEDVGQRDPNEGLKWIGWLGERYALLEEGGEGAQQGLIVLDVLLAQERILFESLLKKMKSRAIVVQKLLMPIVLEMDPQEMDWMEESGAFLMEMGFEVEIFGSMTVKLDAVPLELKALPPAELLLQGVRSCRKEGQHREIWEEAMAKNWCSMLSQKQPFPPFDSSDWKAFLNTLWACDIPYTCPQGRPTLLHIGGSELARRFGRGR